MKFISSAVALSLTLACSQALCWGDIGHQTVGEVAQRYLTPETKQKIEQIMGAEILQASAIWPDIVRSDDRHKTFGNYHFLDVPAGMKYADIPADKKAKRNGDTVIQNFGSILTSAARTRDEKMLAIRYLVHVVGDVHQPLHVGNSYDMGANTCNVRLKLAHFEGEKFLNLHSLWDEEIIEFVKEDVRQKEISEAKRLNLDAPPKRFFGASSFADMVVTGNPEILAAKAEIETAVPAVWYQEAADVRTSEVYPDKEAGLSAPVDEAKRPYCVNIKDRSQKKAGPAPLLGAEYMSSKVLVIQKQIYKAGLRLAYMLNTLSKNKNFTQYKSTPTKNKICPLKATIGMRGADGKYVDTPVDTNMILSPSEQAMATVLSPDICEVDFLKDLYLARLSEKKVKK
ncbi:MAG: S1/P1 nuclease [Bdellovibrionales bacterium]|nr:S1/P1 nuclease [Bdellovibrionales bacterium]